MRKYPFSSSDMPFEIQVYLSKHELPEKIIRRHVCPDHRRELWIAPPVDDMEKSLLVSKTV
jgi:hypothetical protein